MARRPLIAGNWKMNLERADACELATKLKSELSAESDVEVAVCPPYVYLDAVAEILRGTPLGWGGQDMYFEPQGAFTGEVSGEMLVDLGCRYVILGHSERRHLMGETNELVNQKLHRALACGLVPIVCVGELLEQREAGQTLEVIRDQFQGSLAGVTAEQMQQVVIAYEPVWAIGTGKVASPEQAEEVHADLRQLVETQYNATTAAAVRIQYGGSVKPDNADQLLSQPNIDGALVGGASLKSDQFTAIVAAGRSSAAA